MLKKLYLVAMSILVVGALTACSGNSNANSEKVPQNNETQKTNNTNNESEDVNNENLMKQNFSVSYTDAINMFNDKYKDADIVNLDFEKDLNKYLYTVEGVDDNNEYKMKIDANSKEIIQDKTEKLDSEDLNGVARKEKLDLKDIITPQEAMEIALEKQDGIVKEWDLDRDLDVTFYNIKVVKDKSKYEIKVDSKEGKILGVEKED